MAEKSTPLLYYGPLNKSLYTQQFELLAKALLHCPEQITFSLQSNKEHSAKALIARIDQHHYNVSALIEQVNFNHVSLNAHDSAQYQYFLQHQAMHLPEKSTGQVVLGPHYFQQQDPNGKYAHLSFGEKCAINIYTTNYYSQINHFLKGNLDKLSAYFVQDQQEINGGAKELLLHIAMLSSGLNKLLPDIEANWASYRGESKISDLELHSRIEAIEQGGDYTSIPSFISTSIDLAVCEDFAGKSLIIFDNVYGKDISSLSAYPYEQEYLLSPTHMLWKSYSTQVIGTDYPYAKYLFVARPVTPLIETPPIDTQALTDLKTLVDFAQHQKLALDFFTTENLAQLAWEPKPTLLTEQALTKGPFKAAESALSHAMLFTPANDNDLAAQLDDLAPHDLGSLATASTELDNGLEPLSLPALAPDLEQHMFSPLNYIS